MQFSILTLALAIAGMAQAINIPAPDAAAIKPTMLPDTSTSVQLPSSAVEASQDQEHSTVSSPWLPVIERVSYTNVVNGKR